MNVFNLPGAFRVATCFLVFGAMAVFAVAGDVTAYHIGNSLTGDLTVEFPAVAESYEKAQGNTYLWALHFRPATSLTFMYSHPNDPKTASINSLKGGNHVWQQTDKPGFLPWTKALPEHHWDIVTLQVWQDDDKATLKRDTEAVNGIIAATRQRADNATTRFFIYAPWTVSKFNELDSFTKAYTAPTAKDPDTLGVATRDYFRHVVDSVRKTNPDVALIPAGEVFVALDSKMRAGKFEHFTSVQQLHRDVIHLNSIGKNVAAWTAYAVIFKKSPVGLPNDIHADKEYPPFKNVTEVSPADLKLIQETIWELVTSPDLRGYTHVPEPAAGRGNPRIFQRGGAICSPKTEPDGMSSNLHNARSCVSPSGWWKSTGIQASFDFGEIFSRL